MEWAAIAIGLLAGACIGWWAYQNEHRAVALVSGGAAAAVGLIWDLANDAEQYGKIGEAGIRDLCYQRRLQYPSFEACRADLLADAGGVGVFVATLLLGLGLGLLGGYVASWLLTRTNPAGQPASPPRPATSQPASPPSTAPSRPPGLTDMGRLNAPGRIPEQSVAGATRAVNTSKGVTCPNCSRTFMPRGFPKVRCPYCSTRFLAKRATPQ